MYECVSITVDTRTAKIITQVHILFYLCPAQNIQVNNVYVCMYKYTVYTHIHIY